MDFNTKLFASDLSGSELASFIISSYLKIEPHPAHRREFIEPNGLQKGHSTSENGGPIVFDRVTRHAFLDRHLAEDLTLKKVVYSSQLVDCFLNAVEEGLSRAQLTHDAESIPEPIRRYFTRKVRYTGQQCKLLHREDEKADLWWEYDSLTAKSWSWITPALLFHPRPPSKLMQWSDSISFGTLHDPEDIPSEASSNNLGFATLLFKPTPALKEEWPKPWFNPNFWESIDLVRFQDSDLFQHAAIWETKDADVVDRKVMEYIVEMARSGEPFDWAFCRGSPDLSIPPDEHGDEMEPNASFRRVDTHHPL